MADDKQVDVSFQTDNEGQINKVKDNLTGTLYETKQQSNGKWILRELDEHGNRTGKGGLVGDPTLIKGLSSTAMSGAQDSNSDSYDYSYVSPNQKLIEAATADSESAPFTAAAEIIAKEEGITLVEAKRKILHDKKYIDVRELQDIENGSKILVDGEVVDKVEEKKTLLSDTKTTGLRCKIQSKVTGEMVTFHVSPNIDESRSAAYDSISPIHHPGSIHAYKSSSPRNLNINGRFIARSKKEASRTLYYLNLIRSWVMPYYGTGTAQESLTQNNLGAPPDILNFTAYGNGNLNNIPVVLSSYSWTYPDDVDYIPTLEGEPCPVTIDVSLTLMESYSPEEFSKFDLISYKLGKLDRAFNEGTEKKFEASSTWKNYAKPNFLE